MGLRSAELEGIERLNRDLKAAAATLSEAEARYLVDLYYIVQENRKRTGNQIGALAGAAEPNALITWMFHNQEKLETDIKKAMEVYSSTKVIGRWSKSITGIGPVIAAGLMAHIDIERAPTVGHIWRFAGLDPTQQWEKGKKRPWNAELKTLCWKIGESFVKQKGRESDVYGKIYEARKELEAQRNAEMAYQGQAAAKLERFKIGKTTEAYGHYTAGHLPPAHLHARAKRYAVKLFLAHWHHVAYVERFGTPPPRPYILEHAPGQHVHYISPPNWPLEAEAAA